MAAGPEDWPALLADEDANSSIGHDLIEVVVRDGRRPLTDVAVVRVRLADFHDATEQFGRAYATTDMAPSEAEVARRLSDANDRNVIVLEVV